MAIEMSEVFWTFFITSLIGFLLAVGKLCYKSKCSEINLCCLKVVRNIESEVKEDLELGTSSKDTEESKKNTNTI
jgi:hypothetical protein